MLNLLALTAAFVALLAPGVLLRQQYLKRTGRLFSLIWVAIPGLLALALVGLLAWFGLPAVEPARISDARWGRFSCLRRGFFCGSVSRLS